MSKRLKQRLRGLEIFLSLRKPFQGFLLYGRLSGRFWSPHCDASRSFSGWLLQLNFQTLKQVGHCNLFVTLRYLKNTPVDVEPDLR